MVGNCDATKGAGLSNALTPGWGNSADCSFAMNICSPPTGPSSISLASGSRCGNVYETLSTDIDMPWVRLANPAIPMTDVFRTHHPRTASCACMFSMDRRQSAR